MKESLAAVRQDAIKFASDCMIASFVISLHDEFGFGPKRMKRLLEKVNLQFDCVEAGTVSLEDLAEWCNENYGLDLRKKLGD